MESRTQLKTVKITLNIFAVCSLYQYNNSSLYEILAQHYPGPLEILKIQVAKSSPPGSPVLACIRPALALVFLQCLLNQD